MFTEVLEQSRKSGLTCNSGQTKVINNKKDNNKWIKR